MVGGSLGQWSVVGWLMVGGSVVGGFSKILQLHTFDYINGKLKTVNIQTFKSNIFRYKRLWLLKCCRSRDIVLYSWYMKFYLCYICRIYVILFCHIFITSLYVYYMFLNFVLHFYFHIIWFLIYLIKLLLLLYEQNCYNKKILIITKYSYYNKKFL